MTKEELLASIEDLKKIVDVPWPRSRIPNDIIPEEITLPVWVLDNFAEVSKFLREAEAYLMKDK